MARENGLPGYNYYCKHPWKYEKNHCAKCQKEYVTDVMLRKTNHTSTFWFCLKCYNDNKKEAA